MAQDTDRSWDPGRFVKTLAFFDAIPILRHCSWLKQVLGLGPGPSIQPSPAPPMSQTEASSVLMDFSQPSPMGIAAWGALDDGVMGGVSQSGAYPGDGALVFSGTVSTANSGGFSSIRTRNFERPLDCSGWDGIEVQVRGDGNRYKLFARGEERWDGVAHAQSFDTQAGEWLTVRLPFSDFCAVFRAKTVPDRPLDRSQIYALQLMLSKFEYDGLLNPHFTPGPFLLEVRAIALYRQASSTMG